MKTIKIGTTLLICFIITINTFGQTLSEAEVSATMFRAFELNKAKNYKEALEAFLLVGKNTDLQRTEEERQVYVCSQTMAIMCYESLQQYEAGYALGKKLIAEELTDTEKKDVAHLYVMNGYFYATGFMHRDNADYDRARNILIEIAPYADDQMKNYVLPKIPMTWYFEGAELQMSQKYEEATEYMIKAKDGFHEIGSIKNELDAIRNLGDIKRWQYDTLEALAIYESGIPLAKQLKDDGRLYDLLVTIKGIRDEIGDMEGAAGLTHEMDSLANATKEDGIKIKVFTQRGEEASKMKMFQLSALQFQKVEKLIDRIPKEERGHLRYSNCASMRNMYAKSGNYELALKYADLVIDEFQRLYSPEDKNYFMPYMVKSEIYKQKGDREKCFNCIDTLFRSESRFDEPREIAQLYRTRGGCYAAFKEYELALKDYKKADEILAQKYDVNVWDRVLLLPLLGGMENKLQHFETSEHLYRLYAEKAKQRYGEQSQDYASALIYLANAEAFAGHTEQGCKRYIDAVELLKTITRDRLPFMSATERAQFWEEISGSLLNMTPYALKAGFMQDDFTKSCYDAVLQTKAFLLETERSIYDALKQGGDQSVLADYSMLASMKKQISDWEKDYVTHADSIMLLSEKINLIDKQLTRRSQAYGDITSFMDIDYGRVKHILGKNDVLVDFTDYVSESVGRRYAAYIIKKEQNFPLLRQIFTESQIDSIGIVRPDMYYSADYAQDVNKLLWEPIKDCVNEGATVYYVPSQLLFQISLESLPLKDGTLLGEHYNFVRLSSARELIKKKAKPSQSKKASGVLYGGLQYDVNPDTLLQESKRYNLTALKVRRGDIAHGDSIFRELPRSKDEIEKISTILRESKYDVTPYTGMRGTEESFLNMHGQAPKILHLATHGFYFTPDDENKGEYLKGYTDAMSLSGLVLSGGNAAWLGKELPEGVLGGILTANNIARLDLSGIDMVVLSACQSGQGVATPEGLYGLQRAFKKAGVGTMVMALWDVDDDLASEFMVKFYESLVYNKWDRHKAFKQAQKEFKKKHEAPEDWAAFVILD